MPSLGGGGSITFLGEITRQGLVFFLEHMASTVVLSIVRLDGLLTPPCFCSLGLLVILITGLVKIGEFLVLANS